MLRILIVVQARTGSSRLPGKVLLQLAGAPLLQRMIERLQAGNHDAEVLVATTTKSEDDAIASLCLRMGVPFFRGHPHDLLDRHYRAAVHRRADVVVKIPSDCPLIDPAVVDRVLDAYRQRAAHVDYMSNLHPATYPDGNDVEVMPLSVLEQAWVSAKEPYEREHTTPFIWDRPKRFRLANVTWETGEDASMTHRFVVDYPEDYLFVHAVYERLWSAHRAFGIDDILELLRDRPELYRINLRYCGVNWYRDHLGALKTVDSSQTRSLGDSGSHRRETESQ